MLTLFLMAISIAYVMFHSVILYAGATSDRSPSDKQSENKRVARLLSGFANVGNGVIHAILLVYMKANEANDSVYWREERKLGGMTGPGALMLINMSVGLFALTGASITQARVSLGWNGFVIVMGTAIPIVWHRFLAEGLTEWPHVPVFIWFYIFAMELTAFATSAVWWALSGRKTGEKQP